MSKKRFSNGKLARLTLKERKKRAVHNERTHRAAKVWKKQHVVRERFDPRASTRAKKEAKKDA
jgi:hypothetical protein